MFVGQRRLETRDYSSVPCLLRRVVWQRLGGCKEQPWKLVRLCRALD